MMSMNIPSRKEEGFDTYCFRVRGKLCLLVSGRSLPLFRRRHNDPLHIVQDNVHWMPCNGEGVG